MRKLLAILILFLVGELNFVSAQTSYFWVGGQGNWGDNTHWAVGSGGAGGAGVPSITDTVVFDAASFVQHGDTVFMDLAGSCAEMTWELNDDSTVLFLSNGLSVNGDVTLDEKLSVISSFMPPTRLVITATSFFDPDSAWIDAGVLIDATVETDTIRQSGYLNLSDRGVLYLASGNYTTLSNGIQAASIVLLDLPPPAMSRASKLLLNNSELHLLGTLDASLATNTELDAGNSHIYIDSSGLMKGIFPMPSDSFTLYNVTLDFNESTSFDHTIRGNNVFNDLVILPGSHVVLDSLSNQTVNACTMVGNCRDSIYLTSSNVAFASTITNANAIAAECADIRSINVGTGSTALFSTDGGSNTGWTFLTDQAATSSFTIDGPFCLGDTTYFTNNSSVFSGNANDMNIYWNFGDTAAYVSDTNRHVYDYRSDFIVTLVTEFTNFCTDTLRDTVHINDPNLFVFNSQPDTTICAGEEVNFEVTSSFEGVTFETFLNGVSQNTPSVNDILYSTSTLNNLDTVSFLSYENGCPGDPIDYVFVVNPVPVISFVSDFSDSTICIGDSVTFTASGTDSYRYLINNSGVTPFVHDSLNGGIYSTVTLADNDTINVIGRIDSTGCTTNGEMIFNVHPLPETSLTSSATQNVICTGDVITFTGHNAEMYEFFVNGISQGAASSDSTFQISTLVTGDTVELLGISVNGCQKYAQEEFVYTVNPLPNVGMTLSDADSSICAGDVVTFDATGAALYEFTINGVSQGGQSSTNSFITTSLTHGDVVQVIGEFSGCLNTSGTATFEVLAAPTTTLVSDDIDQSICQGTAVTFTASGATNYQFFVNGVSQGSASNVSTFVTSGLIDDQIISVQGESSGCVVSQSMQFNVLPVPTIPIFSNDPDNTICDGESVTFSSNNGETYEWFIDNVSQGAATTVSTFSPVLPLGNTTISVVGTNGVGCTDTSDVPIMFTVNAIPSITLSSNDADNIVCAGSSVTFTGSGSSEYQFFIDGVSQGVMSANNSITTTNLSNGQVVLINGNTMGCSSTSNAITMVVNSNPALSFSGNDLDNIFCEGSSVSYTASGATNFEFFVNGQTQGAPSANGVLDMMAFPDGLYDVEVVGESNGCVDSSEVNVTINPVPIVTLTNLTGSACFGNQVQFNASGAQLYKYFVNNMSQGSFSPVSGFSSALANNDVVSVIGQSILGCVDTVELSPITVNATPTITLTSNTTQLCSGDLVTLNASGGNEYEFFLNGQSFGVLSTTSTISIDTLEHNDEITVFGQDANGCSATSSPINFTVNDYPVVSLSNNSDTVICVGGLLDLNASGAIMYQFAVNNIPVAGFSTNSHFTQTVNNGDVVTVSGEINGCVSSSNAIQFTVYDYPSIVTVVSDADTTICFGDTVNFTASGAMNFEMMVNGTMIDSGNGPFEVTELDHGDVVTITGFNGMCASVPNEYDFTVNKMNLNLSVTPSSMICDGDQATFTATGGDQYSFQLNSSEVQAMSTNDTYASSSLSDQDEVTITAYSTQTGCTQELDDYILMNVLTTPVITAQSSLEFCEGDSVLLISNYAFGNQWYLDGEIIPGATDTSFIATTSGNYSVESTAGGIHSVWSVGLNANGTFGDMSNFNSELPVPISGTQIYKQLSTGFDFVLGVATSGQLYAWGVNSSGQLGNGTYTGENAPIEVAGLSSTRSIATTESSSMALMQNGDVYVWGNNVNGQLATGNTNVINFPMLNSGLVNIDSIVGGRSHFLMLRNDGTVWSVGNNDFGQLGQGNLSTSFNLLQVPGLSGIETIGAGEYTSYAIDSNQVLYVWGANSNGQLGLGDYTTRMSPIQHDLSGVEQADGGAVHSVFRTSNGHVYTSGGNDFGQLGIGSTDSLNVPQKIAIQGVEMISASQYNTLMLRSDQSVFGCGSNLENQLGASSMLENSPKYLIGLDGVSFIEAGRATTHVISSELKACVSVDTEVVVNSVPTVGIVQNGMQIEPTETGDAYQWYFNGNVIPGETGFNLTLTADGVYTVEVMFASGCSSISDDFNHNVAGVHESDLGEIKVYPNPNDGQFTIELSQVLEDAIYQLMDLSGKVIATGEVVGTLNTVSVELPSGTYLLRMGIQNGRWKVQRVTIL